MPLNCDLGAGEGDREFLGRVDTWVDEAAAVRPSADEFLKLLPGVWPGEAVASLKRLQASGHLPYQYAQRVEKALRAVRPEFAPRDATAVLEVPLLEHPLDFEWLFTVDAQDTLLRELRHVGTGTTATVLCLGCPTLFERGERYAPGQKFVLWDKNASARGQMSEARAIANIDLRHESAPSVSAAAAVLDPPWYGEFYRLFLWAALRNLHLGATILMSFPPEGTRPSALQDFSEILEWAKWAGAEFVSRQRACLPYRSPLFEVNALAAAGFNSIPLDWRRGDLLTFRKECAIEIDRPLISQPDARWEEHRFGGVRLRIRAGGEESSPALLRTVAGTAVLPSVSTRFPNRHSANVVTSGNRFFHVRSPAHLDDLCRTLSRRSFEAAIDDTELAKSKGTTVLQQLEQLVLREQLEASEYLKRINGH